MHPEMSNSVEHLCKYHWLVIDFVRMIAIIFSHPTTFLLIVDVDAMQEQNDAQLLASGYLVPRASERRKGSELGQFGFSGLSRD